MILALLLALAQPPPEAARLSSASPAFERSIEVAGTGRVAVRLDRSVYEGARPDLADLRVLDEDGGLVPFLLDRGTTTGLAGEAAASVRNEGWQGDGAVTAVLDLGERRAKSRLRLSLSGDNFRRRVAVEASDDGRAWVRVVDEAWVFAIPGPDSGRYETIALPENDYPLLRVTVHPGEGERGRLRVHAAAVPALAERPRREQRVPAQWTRAEDRDRGETWLTLDLGARHQPFHAVELEVADERFFREARVLARRESGMAGAAIAWEELGRGAVHRLEHAGRRHQCLRLDVCGRERVLRVRLRNADDRPLSISGVFLRVPVERVAFEAVAGRSYRLAYGSPAASAPSFDLARTAGEVGAWVESATEATLGPVRRAHGRQDRVPWTERHPALLWGGLLAVVASLGLLTARALRQAGR